MLKCARSLYLLGFEVSTPPGPFCLLLGSCWSLLFLSLLVISGATALASIRHLRRRNQQTWSIKVQQELILHTVRLLLIACAVLTLAIYIHSVAPHNNPAILSRYLICLWITLPALLWPLWTKADRKIQGLSKETPWWFARGKKVFYRGGLLLLLCISVFGTSVTLTEIPTARVYNEQENALIDNLLHRGITHIYTDYWVCDRIAFQSQERIICAVLNLQECIMPPDPNRYNRYMPYYVAVYQNPSSSYMLPGNSPCNPAVVRHLQKTKVKYRQFDLQGYRVYQVLKR